MRIVEILLEKGKKGCILKQLPEGESKMALKSGSSFILRVLGYVLLILVALDAYACTVSDGRMSFVWNPLFFCCCFSSRYSEVMEIPVEHGGKTVPCKLYRRSGAPFLLLGPYPFLKGHPLLGDRSDFFFIGRDRVMGRALDEKTEDWKLKYKWVWIGMDLDPNERNSQAPSYIFHSTCVFDPQTDNVHFACSAN